MAQSFSNLERVCAIFFIKALEIHSNLWYIMGNAYANTNQHVYAYTQLVVRIVKIRT